jgi:hypothetical protein
MIEFVKYIIGLVITGFIGNKIASYFQQRSFLNQAKIKNAEIEVKKITDISFRVMQFSSKRRYTLIKLIDALLSHDDINNNDITAARKEYKDAVREWNLELPVFYMELSNINLYSLSLELEREIHNNFREIHKEINNSIKTGSRNNLLTLDSNISYIYSCTKELSNQLINEAHARRDKILNGDTEELSQYNLHKVSMLKLIIAIFYSDPKRLRVPRSS